MDKEKKKQEELSIQEGIPLDEEETEDIAEEIQELVENDNPPAAIELISKLHPGDQSEVIEELPPETQQKVLTTLEPEEAAEILEHLDPEDAVKATEGMDPAALSDILDEADSDVQADILRQMPKDRSVQVLKDMEEAEEVIPLLQYPDDSAGGRMVLEYVSIKADATAAHALDTLRELESDVQDVHSIYVIDDEDHLLGELSIVRLALAKPQTAVRDIMDTEVISVSVDMNQEECARIIGRYALDQLPVVDEKKRLVGVIMSTDIIEVIEEEATEDMYKLSGITGERVSGSLSTSIRNRFPWLSINLVTTFIAAAVISIFESTIARVVTLAVFLPVVAGQGGIGGTQTLTLVVRGMALGEISRRGGFRLLGREILLGILHGLLLGALVGVVVYLWKGNYMLGVVLAMAMVGNMIIAGLSGAGVPLLLARLKIDPALASAVIVTTCTDVFGFLLFLGLATALVSFLL